MKKIIAISALFFSVAACIGCNTSRGVGKDVEQTGKNIQETVDRND